MLKIIEEGKTKEDALNKIINQQKITIDDMIYTSEYVDAKLFKSSKYIVKAILKKEIKEDIEEFVANLSKLMNIKIETEVLSQEDSFNITLISENNSVLIGHNGKTLSAIQTLIRQKIKKDTDLDIKINLDIAAYKVKKLKSIEIEVRKLAEEIIDTKIDASLEPMNSYERRFVHNLINEYDNLTTESIGIGLERHVVIKYKA